MGKKTQAAALIRSRIIGHGDVNPEDLLANPLNFRRHPGHQMDALRGSMKELGWLKTILVNKTTGHVLDGHARVEEAMRQGLKTIPATIVELAPEEERLALAVLDPITELATRDQAILDELLAEVSTADAGLQALLDELAGKEDPALKSGLKDGVDPDAVPEPPKVPVTQPGDLYILGDHRLLCGDSTKKADVDRLMNGKKAAMVFTDPPYALFGNSTGVEGVADDKMVRPFFRDILGMAKACTKPYGHIYACCDWHSAFVIEAISREVELKPKNLIVWDKGDGGIGSAYQNCHELVWFWSNAPSNATTTKTTSGERPVQGKANIWRFSRVPSSEREHNAAKPVEMIEVPLNASSDPGDLVLDLFGGSGSTLIAAEKAGRVAYLMEVEPKFCDVIVKRWEEATGRKAERHRGAEQ